ncbi:type IV pilin protein [Neisseria perflava]|uniref:type IV pilin protein n=1 Tax=Neisseria perflava TaxID=33053 RepID=UPI0020A0D87F|nr:type IV pilin protein [Neisseria perflava]MCP1661113.1 Tfp pilus assembly protein PilE [Neisseria perflava]
MMRKNIIGVKIRQNGISLTQMVIVVLLLAILAVIAFPLYENHVKEAKLRAAQSALLANSQFLERHYQQKGSFKKNSTTWPSLPVQATDDFCIRLHGVARGALDSKYTLKAVALDKTAEPRIIKMNESLTTIICESSTSSCDDDLSYFKGSDKKCTVYQN